jgi:hypothetical protein
MTQEDKTVDATPEGAGAPADDEKSQADEGVILPSSFGAVLRWLLMGLGVVLLALGLLWGTQTVARHEANATLRKSIGVVDIDQALAAHRNNYLEMINKESATDQQREQATAYVKASTELINEGLAIIADECGCVLLIKPAVLQHQQVGLVDYTARLLELTKDNSGKGR